MKRNATTAIAAALLAAIAIALLIGPCEPGRPPSTWRTDPIGKFVRWIAWRTFNEEFKPKPPPPKR